MAHRTVRILSSALEGVPFHVRSIQRSKGVGGFLRFDVALTIDDVSSLRPREGSLMGSKVTLVIQEPGAEASHVQGTVTAVSQLERPDVGGASLRLTVIAVPDADPTDNASR
ncbi:MAG: hypothetical protein IT372_00655 [Polyangiaceae bacterium]|nr:hypothetical protein [Polyangiaceae bacterium]